MSRKKSRALGKHNLWRRGTPAGLIAKRRLGQHFLEQTWIKKVIAAVEPKREDYFIEIGPGTGALTFALAERSCRVLAVEVDPDLVAGLRKVGHDSVETLEADFLDIELSILIERLGVTNEKSIRIVGNLPYNISVPILSRTLRAAKKSGVTDATFMLQHEVAARVVASVGAREYGPLAVMATLHSDARRLFDLPGGAFRPAPRVRSSLVALRFREAARTPTDINHFYSVVRTLFSQRRKYVVNGLARAITSSQIDAATLCQRAGVVPTRRPGELTLPELIELAEVLKSSK